MELREQFHLKLAGGLWVLLCRIAWVVFDVATRQSLEEVSVLVRPEQLLAPAAVLTKLGVTQEQLFAACTVDCCHIFAYA